MFLEGANHEQSSLNNNSAWCFCVIYGWGGEGAEGYFKKKPFHRGTNFFGQVILNRRTNDYFWG